MAKRTRHSPRRAIPPAIAVARVLAGCTPLVLGDIQGTRAQLVEPSAVAADIPAQPLAEALAEFAAQAGLQLVYLSELVSDQRSHA